MDKAELIRHEIEKRRVHNLAIGNPLFAAMAEEDIELLSFIDSMQEEPVSEDLNTAAKMYTDNITDKVGYKLQLRRAVVYGDKWHKEQMMTNAVEGQIYRCYMEDGISIAYGVEANLDEHKHDFSDGDKVKLVIIKKD